jgi:hypothetical protein
MCGHGLGQDFTNLWLGIVSPSSRLLNLFICSEDDTQRRTLIHKYIHKNSPSTSYRFLNTLPVVAGAATFGVAAFFAAPPPIPLIVPITVLFTGAFLTGAAFFTMVVELLASLDSLILLALPFPTLGAGAETGALLPLPAPAAELAVDEVVTLRPTLVRVDFAFSTMLVSIAAAPPWMLGADGFSGDIGRVKADLLGD